MAITDQASGLAAGLRRAWPESDRWISEWHLESKLRQRLTKVGLNSDTERIWRRLDYAFISVYHWESFTICAWRERKRCPRVWKWIEDNEPLILDQFSRRRAKGDRHPPWPRSSGALETRGEKVKAAIAPRRNGFRNRERLNRLLMLMQLELNADASERDYALLIRNQLRAQDGIAPARRVVADRGHKSSLLAKPSKQQIARAHRGRSQTPRRRRRPKP